MIIKKGMVFLLLMMLYVVSEAQKLPVYIIDSVQTNRTLRMPWRNCIAVGRAQNLLRNDLLAHLSYAQKIMGYKFCRFHAIFDDELQVVSRDSKTNKLIFQWSQVDKVYDALLQMGIKPFVELNPMPKALASGTQTMFYYKMNVTPPTSYDDWEFLVSEFTKHLVDRYGINEVRTWYFEVWNEPNLNAFWSGSMEEYFKLYKASAKAVKRVDSLLKVGGPASSKGSWIADIINYTSTNHIPLDFVSTHLYPQDEQVVYPDRNGSPYAIGDFFKENVKKVLQIVRQSVRPNLEIHWTEWNTLSAPSASTVSWTKNNNVDNLFAASFIVKNCLALDTVCNTLGYWVVSDIFDEAVMPQTPFSCGYGLLNINGIPKASFNGFKLLRKMTGQIVKINKQEFNDSIGKGIFAVRENNKLRILMWNQNFVELSTHSNFKGTINLPSMYDSSYLVLQTTIKIGAGSAWESWNMLGAPNNLSTAELEFLWTQSIPQTAIRKMINRNISFEFQPGEVGYLEIIKKGANTQVKNVSNSDLEIWEKGMGKAEQAN